MTRYECKECGAMVAPGKNGLMHRSCEHKDAPIIANIQATASGVSKVNSR